MNNRIEEILQLAKDEGLDFFPVVFEIVEKTTMNNVCAYGLPTRARHWSYGRSYDHQKTYGEMGLSKVYEVILNNNPSYAFMLDTNTPVQNLFIAAHCSAHCFITGTLIETQNGPKNIEDITLNDKILTHKGIYRKPMALSKTKHKGYLYTIGIGSHKITCTPEHPFYVVSSEECVLNYRKSICRPNCKYKNQDRCKDKPYSSYEPSWLKAQDIKIGDFLVYPKNKTIGCEPVKSFIINGEKEHGHPGGVKEVEYTINIDEAFGEFLGLYLAEGYAREGGQMGLCFHTKEKGLHKDSHRLIKQLFELKTYNSISEDTHSHQVLFNEKVLANWLINNLGRGSGNKQIPDFLLKSGNEKFFLALLKGLFHGDGHGRDRSINLTTTSSILATQVRQICAKYNYITNIKIRKYNDKKTAYVITLSGTSRVSLLNDTGIYWNNYSGNRSYEFGWYDEDNIYIPVKTVDVSCNNEEEVYNLEVPKDSSYTLFAGAITHNSDFFKNNIMFKGSDRNMIRHAAEHAGRVEKYIEKYGFDKVEHLMDVGFALDNHIDWHKGLYRKPYDEKKEIYRKRNPGEFDDLLYKKYKPTIVKDTVNDKFPPSPERDLLWFLITYAPLKNWEVDLLNIIRTESFYFYPQMMTKILNEGWACLCPGSLVFSPQNGMVPIEELVDKGFDVIDRNNNTHKLSDKYNGYKICRNVKTKRGFELSGAENHGVLCWDEKPIYKKIKDLCSGDKVVISSNQNCWSNKTQKLPSVSLSGKEREGFKLPKYLNKDVAKFLGYFLAEGHIGKRCVCLTNGDLNVAKDMCLSIEKTFGYKVSPREEESRYRVEFYSTSVCELLNKLNLSGGARNKRIPKEILTSPKSVVIEFLSAAFTGDGGAYNKYGILALSTGVKENANIIQLLLLNLGIVSTISVCKKSGYEDTYQVWIRENLMKKAFSKIIKTSSKLKEKVLNSFKNHNNKNTYKWSYNISDKDINNISLFLQNTTQKKEKEVGFNSWRVNKSKSITLNQINSLEELGVKSNISKNWVIDEVKEVSIPFESKVYDMTVPNVHEYQAQGFINHNSFWHAELMFKYNGTTPEEHIDFCRTHEKVVQPGGNPFRINPYFLGFKIFKDIEKRWDEKYKNGESNISGREKIFKVRAEEDDISFVRNYLTKELVEELHLFTYGYEKEYPEGFDGEKLIQMKSRSLNDVVESIVSPLYNCGAPKIVITGLNREGGLVLKHDSEEIGTLNFNFAKKTLEYLWHLWTENIELHTKDDDGNEVILCFDEVGFYVKKLDEELDFLDEEEKNEDFKF